jgi:methyl-accepting chemotaxis protein
MSNWTIGRRLVVAFAVTVAILVSLSAYSYYSLKSIDYLMTRVSERVVPGLYAMGQVEKEFHRASAFLLDYIQSTDQARMARIEADLKEVDERVSTNLEAYDKTILIARDRELFARIVPIRERYTRVRNDVLLPLVRAGKRTEALDAYRTQFLPILGQYEAAVRDVMNNKKAISDEVSAETHSTAQGAEYTMILGALLGLGLSIGLALFIVRSVNSVLKASVTELREGSEQVVSAASQVSTSSQSLSQGATEQAASLEETSASMEEMASMTRKNAESSQAAATLMSEVDARVTESNEALRAMVGSMASIKDSSAKVSKIIKTIDEIAFQTNILALNAAVEAARAGEAGMGFAVVADEVRNLAQRSAQAAKDTAGLIEESIVNSNEGSRKVEQVAASIEAITDSVGKVKGLVQEVSVASRQQSQGIDQVSQAVAQMEKVTQTTAATAEESAAASEELNAQAEASMAVVARLESLVGRTGTTAVPSRASRPAAKTAGLPKVVAGTITPAAKRPVDPAEEAIPLGGTGTYGKF